MTSWIRFVLAVKVIAVAPVAVVHADLPPVSSANLVAHFEASDATLELDELGQVLRWTANNDASFTLVANGTDPANIRFNGTEMKGLGTIEVNDFSGDNQTLRGPLPSGLTAATIFWVGYYDPGRNGSLGSGSGQYVYSIGTSGSQGSQMDHQIDDGNFELWGGSGTQGGNSIDYLNGSYSVFQTNYFHGEPGHEAFANGFNLNIPSDGGYNVPSEQVLQLFGWQDGSGNSGGYNFVGNLSDLVIYDDVLNAAEAASVGSYLTSRLPATPPDPPGQPDPVTLYAPLSGNPNTMVPGFVPHGNPKVSGHAEFTIYPNNTMDYSIVVKGNEYDVTQAHLYNLRKTSGTSGNPAHGDSIICWGGIWANGGESDEFLQGLGYSNGRLHEVLESPEDWMLIVHTEGGKFSTDESGGLVVYDAAIHEINELGVPESERPTRFNNRVGRTLVDLSLREENTNDSRAPKPDPDHQARQPFADANGVRWVELEEASGQYVLTAAAKDAGYDLDTEYLFYLYDDQGPQWDFGGPEAAFGGFLTTEPVVVAPRGDYNRDGIVDVSDIDAQAIAMETPSNSLATFDENGDLTIDIQDRSIWINVHKNTFAGDANLDLEFNSSDLVGVFASGKYESGAMATWSEGDWDGSLLFDASDMVYAFVGGGYELGPRTAAAGVPEPSSLLLFVFGLTIATLVRLSPVSASLEN
ncbi:MAG: hypothetical protein GY768_23965 [Planctomycetaceae bacterium]|nr:hypothetical protein [Planctomycetaceae bacterium]